MLVSTPCNTKSSTPCSAKIMYWYNMKIPNYGIKEDVGNFKQIYPYMPDHCFKML